jgi:uncharacterized protein YndB with AHSA1/START domain
MIDMEKKGTRTAPDTIRFERRLNAPPEEIWAWLTESDKRGQWLAKGEMQLIPGGTVDLHFNHRDLSPVPGRPPEKYKDMADGHHFTGKILRVDPPRLLSFTWDGGSEVTFDLAASGDGTLLTLTHCLLPTDAESQASVLGGWHTHLDILLAVLAGQTPLNFWTRHMQLEKEYADAIS